MQRWLLNLRATECETHRHEKQLQNKGKTAKKKIDYRRNGGDRRGQRVRVRKRGARSPPFAKKSHLLSASACICVKSESLIIAGQAPFRPRSGVVTTHRRANENEGSGKDENGAEGERSRRRRRGVSSD